MHIVLLLIACLPYGAAARIEEHIDETDGKRLSRDLFFLDWLFGGSSNTFQIWSPLKGTGGPYEKGFHPTNGIPVDVNSPVLQDDEFLLGLQSLQTIVAEAHSRGKQLRASGNKMSMNNIAYTTDYIVDTTALTYCKIGIDDAEHVHSNYTKPKEQLVFVQAGVRLKELHFWLQDAGLALPTYCYPDGVHLVGATLTGSHGSKLKLGSMDDNVKAIHLITNEGHYLVQRESDLIVTESYAAFLGMGTLISDDDLFNAAVVSFGAFGIVHGLLVEVEPLYQLEMEIKRYNYDDISDVLSSLEWAKLGLESIVENEVPYHLAFAINPFWRNSMGVYVQVYKKIVPFSSNGAGAGAGAGVGVDHQQGSSTPDERVPRIVAVSILTVFRLPEKIVYGFLLMLILDSVYSHSFNGTVRSPHNSNTFAGSDTRTAPFWAPQSFEVEIMVSSDDATKTVDLLLSILDNNPFFTDLALRYVSPTPATLGMCRFGPYTASISLASTTIFPTTENGFQKVFDAMATSDIPYAYHWGKRYPVQRDWVADQYGDALLDWLAQRDGFLNHDGKVHVFQQAHGAPGTARPL